MWGENTDKSTGAHTMKSTRKLSNKNHDFHKEAHREMGGGIWSKKTSGDDAKKLMNWMFYKNLKSQAVCL